MNKIKLQLQCLVQRWMQPHVTQARTAQARQRWHTMRDAWAAAPQEMPTRRPSSTAIRLAMAIDSSLLTCTGSYLSGCQPENSQVPSTMVKCMRNKSMFCRNTRIQPATI